MLLSCVISEWSANSGAQELAGFELPGETAGSNTVGTIKEQD